jgi:hypothetical protein
MGDASEDNTKKKPKKATKNNKQKKGASTDGDIGALRRELKLGKQAYLRKKAKPPKAAAPAAAPVEQVDQEDAATAAPTPSVAYQAKCQVVRHMDELAEMVASQLAVLAPGAVITKDAAYELAEIARIAITEMLDCAVEFSESGAGTPEEPLAHGQMMVGVRGWLPESLAKPLFYRAIAEIGTQQGTLAEAQAAFQKYTEVVS